MKKLYWFILIVLAFLTLLSLALNAVVIFGLLQARLVAIDAQQTTLKTVGDARAIITDVSDDTFSYTFTVNQEIPVRTSVPFNEEVVVPIRTTIPISTTVIIPIKAGLLGNFDMDVPVRTFIPVNLDVTVPISHTVNIATTVPLNVSVPIEIPLAETPLVKYLEELDTGLARLEKSLIKLGERWANPLGGNDGESIQGTE